MRGTIRRLALYPFVAALAVMLGGAITAWTYRIAHAQTVSPGEPPVVASTTEQADSIMLDTYRSAPMALLLIFALYGVSRLVLFLDSRRESDILAKLRPYIVTATSVLGGVIVSLSMVDHVDLRVILGALAGAVALELRAKPSPKDPETKPPSAEVPEPLPPATVVRS